MARNSEVIRQWQILREIDGARVGITVAKLAASRQVHQRTIRRDLDALSASGFPLYDDKINGSTVWKLRNKPFRALEETGLGLIELCALYFSRTLLTATAGTPFGEDAERAFTKIERALPAACRRFLDGLPVLLKARIPGRRNQDDRKVREMVNRAIDASLAHRRITMRYHSHASARDRRLLVEPLRISYADGGLYLTAWVPEYGELRNFAAERIETLAVLDDRFEPRPLPAGAVRQFPGCAHRARRARRDRVRRGVSGVCQEPPVACVTDVRDSRRRVRADAARREHRPASSQLDSRLWRCRARRRTANARAGGLRRNRPRATALHAASDLRDGQDECARLPAGSQAGWERRTALGDVVA